MDNPEKNITIIEIIDNLAKYRDGERAESACIKELQKNNDPKIWLILALISLEQKRYMIFGACMRRATTSAAQENVTLEELILELARTGSLLRDYLEETFCPLDDFFDGYFDR